VKLIGDGTIVEFGSVIDAVNCAFSVQSSGVTTPDQTRRNSASASISAMSLLKATTSMATASTSPRA
jgi:class 3 adenylate cyclase